MVTRTQVALFVALGLGVAMLMMRATRATRVAPIQAPVARQAPTHGPAEVVRLTSAPQTRIETPAAKASTPTEVIRDVEDDVVTEPLDVDFDGRRFVWTKDDVARVARAGGTHDLRELAATLLGTTDVRVTITGQTPAGSGSARVELPALGGEDELRMWPEQDGTWSVARNVSRDQGRAVYEQYRLEEVDGLQFARR
jgi:hypothetical protein